jgi:DNA invertase Pin-like site-specific DNA recombinase
MSNQYFAYIRVSTARQGEQGVSLQQQRDAIERYAQRSELPISRWFEEQETAAKSGRPLFGKMIRLLKRRQAKGVLIHKIDRSARNLRDWADLGELIDHGVEVHFANESLDLRSRGGRLSADIQAVVAADYIRNLREETKKGFYGRLKQGLYPMPAPVGYVNIGKGQPKRPDPIKARLVRSVFDLYATARYSLKTLRAEADAMGLRGRSGKAVTLNGISKILNNPFYVGLIRIERNKETYRGVHEPIVTKATFDRVQDILQGRLNTRAIRHDFLFRRRLTCQSCTYSLIGETHKGHVYYRCQTPDCPTTSIREEYADSVFLQRFQTLSFADEERCYFWQEASRLRADDNQNQEKAIAALKLQLAQIDERLNRLTDAYVDRLIDKDLFEQRKDALLMERAGMADQLRQWQAGKNTMSELVAEILERAQSAYLAYKLGQPTEKRDLVDSLTSNRLVNSKTLDVSLLSPFDEIADRSKLEHGSPRRDVARTWTRLLPRILTSLQRKQESQEEIAA